MQKAKRLYYFIKAYYRIFLKQKKFIIINFIS